MPWRVSLLLWVRREGLLSLFRVHRVNVPYMKCWKAAGLVIDQRKESVESEYFSVKRVNMFSRAVLRRMEEKL